MNRAPMEDMKAVDNDTFNCIVDDSRAIVHTPREISGCNLSNLIADSVTAPTSALKVCHQGKDSIIVMTLLSAREICSDNTRQF